MTTDPENLRKHALYLREQYRGMPGSVTAPLLEQAADEIEQLRAAVASAPRGAHVTAEDDFYHAPDCPVDGKPPSKVCTCGAEKRAREAGRAEKAALTSKQETIAHAVRGSDGTRQVCLGFEEAVSKAMRLKAQFPTVTFSIVELVERSATRVCPDSEDGNHVLKQDGPFSIVYCDACGMNRGFRGDVETES